MRVYESEGTGMQCLTRASLEATLYKLTVFGEGCATQNLVASISLIVKQRVSL